MTGLFRRRQPASGGASAPARWTRLIRMRSSLVLAGLLLTALLGVRIWDPPPVEALRLQLLDQYQRFAPRTAGALPVVIIDIDETSLAEIGQWPWPRDQLAEMVRRLFKMGAVVVGFDVIFAEPDRMSPPVLADRLTGLDEDTRRALRDLPANEIVFSAIMRRTRVVLARATVTRKLEGRAEADGVAKLAFGQIGGDPRPFLLAYADVLRNLPDLEAAASGLGNITLSPDRDGVARRVPLVVNVEGELLPSLTVEMLRVATGQSAIGIKSNSAGIDSVVVAGVAIPTDSKGRKWVHFAPHDPQRYVSAADLLTGRVAPERIAGKLVLVGASATGLKDIKVSPVSPAMPGVEIHAQLLENVLAKANLIRPNYALGAELGVLLLVGLLIIVVTPLAGALATLGLGLVVVAALAGGSWWLYAERSLLIDPSYSAIGSFAVYALLTFMSYMREETERKQVREAFAHYLSPALVDRLAENPDQLKLVGEMREVTVMFSDIRGFTSIAERYGAEELTSLVNRILTEMSAAVLNHSGTIDKYIGDCLMAFWNAPLDDAAHAEHACAAAIEMVGRVEILNRALASEAEPGGPQPPAIAVGVGLNTGECLVGNMGSDYRFNYSVMGDSVNLTSRLESQTKYYGYPILLGEETATMAADFACLELDLIRVKGREQPSRVFALLGDPVVRRGAAFAALAKANEELLRAYRGQDWATASDALANCRGRMDGFAVEPLFALYNDRIRDFQAEPPPPGWDGVYVAETK